MPTVSYSVRGCRAMGDDVSPEALMYDYVLTRNEQAFSALHRLYNPQIVGYLTRKVGYDTACDVAQDMWVKVHMKADTYNGAKVRTWLYSIARNAMFDHMRVQSRHVAKTDRVRNVAPTATAPDQSDTLDASGLLSHIDPRSREILTRFYIVGQTGEEVGACMEMGVANVYRVRDKAMRTLCEEVG